MMTPNVLVLGPPKFIGPLGVMRSLGRMGVHVYGLAHGRPSMASISRYCAGTVPVGVNGRPLGDRQTLLDELLQAGQRLGRDTVLIPASDEWAYFVASSTGELEGTFTFSHNSPDLIAALASKDRLASLAAEHRLPMPATFAPLSHEHTAAIAADLEYPVIVKPAQSRPGVTTKAIATGPGELLSWFDRLAESAVNPNVSIQEYIPGRDEDSWLFNGYFDGDSRCLAAFTGTKLRQHPRRMGIATLAVARRNAELNEQSIRFLAAVGYHGAVDIDYRYDSRDGQYKAVDVNPRLGGVFRAFVDASGMDIARALYLDLTGRSVLVGDVVEGRRWVKEDSDLVALRHYHDAEGLTVRGWIRTLRGVAEGGTFSREDPMPFVLAMVQLGATTISGKVKHGSRIVDRAVRPVLRLLVPRATSS